MKQETVRIDNRMYLINQWNTSAQLRNLPKIGKAFAVPLSMLFQADENGIEDVIPQAMFMLFEQLEEQDIEGLFSTLLSEVRLNDNIVNMDESFETLDEVLLVATKVIMLNYGALYSGKGFTGFLQQIAPMAKQNQG